MTYNSDEGKNPFNITKMSDIKRPLSDSEITNDSSQNDYYRPGEYHISIFC